MRCGLQRQTPLKHLLPSGKNPLMSFFARAGAQVKSLASDRQADRGVPVGRFGFSRDRSSAPAATRVSREVIEAATGCRGSAPTVSLRDGQGAAVAPMATSAAGVDHFLPADRRVALTWPKARKPLHAQPTMRPKAARRAAARTVAVVGCAQHTRPHLRLLDLALSGAQDMNACYAKRRAGAALACKHAMAHCSHASAVTARRFA